MRIVLISALLFIVLGIILIPYTGLDGDELLFARPFFGPFDGAHPFVCTCSAIHPGPW